MTAAWSEEELRRIGEADDLHIAPFREGGVEYGTPTWIWSVVVDGAVFVRAYNGLASRWHQAARRERAGRITVAGMRREVRFEPVVALMADVVRQSSARGEIRTVATRAR